MRREKEREREEGRECQIDYAYIHTCPSDSVLGRRPQVFVELIAGPKERDKMSGSWPNVSMVYNSYFEELAQH